MLENRLKARFALLRPWAVTQRVFLSPAPTRTTSQNGENQGTIPRGAASTRGEKGKDQQETSITEAD